MESTQGASSENVKEFHTQGVMSTMPVPHTGKYSIKQWAAIIGHNEATVRVWLKSWDVIVWGASHKSGFIDAADWWSKIPKVGE